MCETDAREEAIEYDKNAIGVFKSGGKEILFKHLPKEISYLLPYFMKAAAWCNQFVIFNPWKTPWNWLAFCQNPFVISPGSLYHLIRRNSRRLANEAVTSNPIIPSKQSLSGLKITNCSHSWKEKTGNWICSYKEQNICKYLIKDVTREGKNHKSIHILNLILLLLL